MTKAQLDLCAALARSVVGERADQALLVPVLLRSLSVEINDFIKYHGDASLAEATVKDHQILMQAPVARRTKKKKDDQSRVDDSQQRDCPSHRIEGQR